MNIIHLKFNELNFIENVVDDDNLSDSNHEDGTIINSCYIIEDNLLFNLYSNGRILSYDLINNLILKHHLDEINDEISDARFSHDQEWLVVVTRNTKNMYLFSKLLVLKCKHSIDTDEYGTDEMISVHWGSKSTQFHGPGQRDSRSVKHVCSHCPHP